MSVLILLLGAIWGALAGQFIVQMLLSLCIGLICLTGIIASKVSRRMNFLHFLVSVIQSIVFGAIFAVGNYISSEYINYDSWNAVSIVSVLSFVMTVVYVSSQIPGKLMLATMCAWRPYFFEASNLVPRDQRVDFARRYREIP